MNTTTPPTAPQAPRRLTKSNDKKLAGVAAGVAEYFAIDPTIVRLLFVASIFLGGFGFICYLIAWMVLPSADQASHPQAPRSFKSTSSTIVAMGLLITGAIIAAATIDNPFGGGFWVPLLLVGGGAFLLLQNDDGEIEAPFIGSSPTAPPAPPTPTDPSQNDRTGEEIQPYSATSVHRFEEDGAIVVDGPEVIDAVLVTDSTDVDADVDAIDHLTTSPTERGFTWSEDRSPDPVVPSSPTNETQPAPPVTALTFAALAALAGGAVLIDSVGWADIAITPVIAIAILIVGSGLLARALLGGGRGLIPMGLLLVVAAGVSAVASPALSDGVGDRDYAPIAFEDVNDEYRLGIGELVVDLRNVDFPAGEHTIDVHLGIGEARVYVPDDVNYLVAGELKVGELQIADQTEDGITNEFSVNRDIEAATTLIINLDVGIGHGQLID